MNPDKTSFFCSLSINSAFSKRMRILCKFFLIIFVYHILKDLKDTLVVTSSDAGAMVIPFLKIWVMLPVAILASFLFTILYQRFGRNKTLYIIITLLLVWYGLFAFCLYPMGDSIHIHHFANTLDSILPVGCKGFVAIIRYWSYTCFYLSAELWSILVFVMVGKNWTKKSGK